MRGPWTSNLASLVNNFVTLHAIRSSNIVCLFTYSEIIVTEARVLQHRTANINLEVTLSAYVYS